MPELVTIPISIFEITIEYETPSLRLWADRTQVAQALFEAFKPWSVDLDNIEIVNQGKNSDKGLTYKLPSEKASFFLGASYCKFTKDDANWNMTEEIREILDAALSTLLEVAKITIGRQRTALSLHLQPKTGKFIDILRPLIPGQLSGLEPAPVTTMATVAKWDNRKVYIDGSGTIANAVFIRLDRDFGPTATYREIAEQLHDDEGSIFNILGVEEDLT